MQGSFGTISRVILVTIATLVLALWPGAASAQGPATMVNGGGAAVMTDPITGEEYPLHFAIAAKVAPDGSVQGHINVVFHGAFAEAFGADTIHLMGTIENGWVEADGTVVLEGTVLERDYKQGEGLIFESYEPLRIEAGGSLGTNDFLLHWCTLPTYEVHITHGGLQIHDGISIQLLAARSSGSLGRCG